MNTDWESRYQTGDMPWEKGAPSPGLLEYLADHPPLTGKILVPGCGWGHDVRAISKPENEVIGFDIAPSAIRGAQSFPVVANEHYLSGDLFALPPSLHGVFDWVWEHTCFCAIDPGMRGRYVEAVTTALKPGGHLLAVFYMNPDHDEGGPPFGASPSELNALFGSNFDLLTEWQPIADYPGREGRERIRLLRKKTS